MSLLPSDTQSGKKQHTYLEVGEPNTDFLKQEIGIIKEYFIKNRKYKLGCRSVGCVRKEAGDKNTWDGGDNGVDLQLLLGAVVQWYLSACSERARASQSTGATAVTPTREQDGGGVPWQFCALHGSRNSPMSLAGVGRGWGLKCVY